ncbi:C40 family peptidase [Frankia gtarii]|uniref:C40 family peptidase n=2 Tax=Frankiaceae TaxID=74712 RepID=UPI0021BE41DB|nr:C40 family peptidase [Frankia gtarii]
MITTSTMAISGVAMASTFEGSPADPETGETRVAAGALGAAVGSRTVTPAVRTSLVPRQSAPAIATARASASLAPAVADLTVDADEPTEVGFRLTDQSGSAVANQDILVQAQFSTGWTTFKILRTDGRGYAGYTAKVLTTTQVRALFAGNDSFGTATSGPAIIRVRPRPQPTAPMTASPKPASRAETRTAVTSTESASTPPGPATGATSIGEKAVYLASLHAGKPYVWGATGPSSFDCSGLVQYVYRQLGKSLPRTTDQQYAATTRIAQGSEQPGDLIFFGQPGGIYHEGIYAGDGKMWAAPKTGDVVKLSKIWTSSYSVGRVQ